MITLVQNTFYHSMYNCEQKSQFFIKQFLFNRTLNIRSQYTPGTFNLDHLQQTLNVTEGHCSI